MGDALASGEIVLDGGLIRIATTGTQSRVRGTRAPYEAANRILNQTGLAQLLAAVDSATQYSKAILGRAPRSAGELSDLYAGLLVHGTEIETSAIARAFPEASLEGVPQMVRMLANRQRLRKANERVVAYLCSHRNGPACTAPMFTARSASLTLGWRLWKAAYDPRHHRQAIPAYGLFIREYGVPRDLPIAVPYGSVPEALATLLERRNRQRTPNPMARRALDAALGNEGSGIVVAKLLGFDVFTPLDQSAKRRLWVPAGAAVPPGLQAAVSEGVSLPAIRKGWQSLVRLAQLVLRRDMGAEPGEMIDVGAASCVAQRHLGRLIRTIHACAYFSNAAFRAELRQFFSEQQWLETLRQAIHHGRVRPAPGGHKSIPRSSDETLTLLANIVLAGAVMSSAKKSDEGCRLP